MVYTHGGTPYVTPHILHKHYAQAFDAEPSNCKYNFDKRNQSILINIDQWLVVTWSISHTLVSTWIGSS